MRVALEEEIKKEVKDRTKPGLWRASLDTSVAATGSLVQFLYTRDQEAEVDLFALQLCRVTGHPDDFALDGLRIIAALCHPGATRLDDYRPAASKLPATLAYYLSESADPLARLRRLLMERDGRVEDERSFGLFVYDRKSGTFTKASDRCVRAEDRPIVFVHGLKGGNGSFRDLLSYLGDRRELLSRKLLIFRYPSNGSLAHAGELLNNEVRRVMQAPSSTTFVAHSAGGLVFRYYAEKRHGGFAHAVLLATPHAGSNLTGLKYLVDVGELAGDVYAAGWTKAIADTLPEGKGQITHDLHPGSLFLRHLGRAALAKRYHVVAGAYFTPAQALGVRVAFSAGKRAVESKTGKSLNGVGLPAEVTSGDLIVSTASAALPGAGRTTKLPLHHAAMKTDPEVMRVVLASVTAPIS
jgi:pimeloyl-ACP methyl ester carboxylesterase